MIGELPKTLNIGGWDYAIRTDYRVALTIFQAYNDPDLSETQKSFVCLNCLFEEPPDDVTEALEKAAWFLDGGNSIKLKSLPVKTIDWEQDESLLFPEINKSAGTEVRLLSYLHWWTFLGYFATMGEGLYSQILNIRQKRARSKKLEKWEYEFLNTHKEMIIIHEKLSAEEQAELDREQALLDKLVG
jgi:hypothetical protein